MSCVSKTTILIFLRSSGIHVELVKMFVIYKDDFEEASEARNAEIGEAVSEEVPATLTEKISAVTYVTMLANHVAFAEMLQRHNEDFFLFLKHMAYCYKALFTDESRCASASIAIIHLFIQ